MDRIDDLRTELAELDSIAAGPGGLTSAGAARRERVRELLREAEALESSLPPELRSENLPRADPPGVESAEPADPQPRAPLPKNPHE